MATVGVKKLKNGTIRLATACVVVDRFLSFTDLRHSMVNCGRMRMVRDSAMVTMESL